MIGQRIPISPVAPAAGCDCDRCPLYLGNPAAVEPVCSGSNTDCGYCGCARSGSGSCGECSIRCGSRVDIGEWMRDIGGTVTFADIDLPDLRLPDGLPSYVPQVDTAAVGELDAQLHWPAYAVGLRRVVSDTTWQIMPAWRDRTAREALNLADDQLCVLVGYGKDPLVEAFWTRRRSLMFAIAEQRWDLVLAPNFSAYGNFPRAEMLINFRRNLLIAQEMLDAGIPAVPNLYSFRLEDLERYAAWAEWARPPAVAVNLQTQRDDPTFFDAVWPALAFLSEALPAETRLIVTGSSRAARISQLLELFAGRLTLVSQNAVQYARRGAVMTGGGRRDIHALPADAFAANVAYYAGLLDQAVR